MNKVDLYIKTTVIVFIASMFWLVANDYIDNYIPVPEIVIEVDTDRDIEEIRRDVEIELLKRRMRVGKVEVGRIEGDIKCNAEIIYKKRLLKDRIINIGIGIKEV